MPVAIAQLDEPAADPVPERFFDRHAARGVGNAVVGKHFLVRGPDGTAMLDIGEIARQDPIAATILETARKLGVTVGFWGGTARDLLLGRPLTRAGDLDLIYDSSEPGFAAFRDELPRVLKQRFGGRCPKVDFSVDRNPAVKMRGPYRGLTVEKIGILSDGRIFDFTGKGLSDLRQGVLRYNSNDPSEPPGLRSVFRMAGASIMTGFPFAPETRAEIDRVMREFYGPDSSLVKQIRQWRAGRSGPARRPVNRAVAVFGEAMYILSRIVRGNVDTDPARALAVLRETGIEGFLRSVGADDRLQPLREAAAARRAEEFRKMTESLDARCRLENLRYGLRGLASALEASGRREIAEALRSRADRLDRRADRGEFRASMKSLLSFELESGELRWEDVEQTLHHIFHRNRGGKVYPEFFRVEPLSNPPAAVGPPPEKVIRRGFEPRVVQTDPASPHSMKDVGDYVRDRLGEPLIRDIIENRRKVEIHSGSREEAFASLRARGFCRFARFHAPRASQFNQIYLAQNNEGEIRYFITEVWGRDRIHHLQQLLRFAEVEGQHLSPDQVELYSDPIRDSLDAYRQYSRAILRSGLVPDRVIIGFKNSLIRELKIRNEAKEKIARLREEFGDRPYEGLLASLDAEPAKSGAGEVKAALEEDSEVRRTLELGPEEVFRSFRNADAVACLERKLAELAKRFPGCRTLKGLLPEGKLPGGSGNLTATVGSDFSDQALLTYTDESGKRHILLLVRTPYGELAGDLGEALADRGVGEVTIVGTAGGLKGDDRVGRIEVPGRLVDADDRVLEGVHNELLSFLLRSSPSGEDRVLGTTSRKVRSPLEETAARIAELKARGYDAVEMETADLFEALSRRGIPVGAAQILSDVPGTEHSLDTSTPVGAVEQSLRQLTDSLIQYYGMTGVEPLAPDDRRAAEGAFDPALALAGRLMEKAGVPTQGHELMRYNLARYLLNGTTAEALTWLSRNWDGSLETLTDSRMMMSRWAGKVKRTLKAPYDNRQVLRQLDHLGEKLRRFVAFLKENNTKGSPYKLYLMGSVCKGRLGSTSDLDVLIDTPDPELERKVIESEFGYKGSKDPEFTAGIFRYAAARMDFYKPAVSIGEGDKALSDPKFLRSLYREICQGYGLEIDDEGGRVEVSFDRERARRAFQREVPIVAERILEYEKSYRKFMDTDFVMNYLRDGGASVEEAAFMPLARIVDVGEDLARALIPRNFTPDRIEAYLETPGGQDRVRSEKGREFLRRYGLTEGTLAKGLQAHPEVDPGELFRPEDLMEILGISDPVERLCFQFAAAERTRRAREAGSAASPFAEELRSAVEQWNAVRMP